MRSSDGVGSARRGPVVLAIAAIFVTLVWTWVLPRVALVPVVHERLRQHRHSGIDASATYYTELAVTEQSVP